MPSEEFPSYYDWEKNRGSVITQNEKPSEFEIIRLHCINGLKSATPKDTLLLISLCSDIIALSNYSMKITGLNKGMNPDLITETLEKEIDKKYNKLMGDL